MAPVVEIMGAKKRVRRKTLRTNQDDREVLTGEAWSDLRGVERHDGSTETCSGATLHHTAWPAILGQFFSEAERPAGRGSGCELKGISL